MTAEVWRKTMRVNLDGAFFTLRAAVRQMLAQGEGGVLCTTASMAAIEGAPRSEHYAATKRYSMGLERVRLMPPIPSAPCVAVEDTGGGLGSFVMVSRTRFPATRCRLLPRNPLSPRSPSADRAAAAF